MDLLVDSLPLIAVPDTSARDQVHPTVLIVVAPGGAVGVPDPETRIGGNIGEGEVAVVPVEIGVSIGYIAVYLGNEKVEIAVVVIVRHGGGDHQFISIPQGTWYLFPWYSAPLSPVHEGPIHIRAQVLEKI